MAYNFGLSTRLSFGEESTAGTPVSTTIGARIRSVDFQEKRQYEDVPWLVGSGSTRNANAEILTNTDVAGTVELDACYAGGCLGLLLKHALGSVSTTGSGPYAHAVSLAAALPNPLTIAVERGTSGADDVLAGCMINRLTLSCAKGETMRARVDFIGMSAAARTTSTPSALTSLASTYLIKHTHAGVLAFNSVNYTLKSIEIVIDNKLARVDQLGSANSDQPAITGHQEITIRATLSGTSNTLQAAHRAQTSSDVSITFSDSPRSLAIVGHNATIREYADPISGVGIVEQTVTFRCLGDDTDNGLLVTLTNADSSVVAS
jgi:hypothetical protein